MEVLEVGKVHQSGVKGHRRRVCLESHCGQDNVENQENGVMGTKNAWEHPDGRRSPIKLHFHMVQSVTDGKWFRVGKAYRQKALAKDWIAFTRSAWFGHRVRLQSCIVTFDVDGRISEKSAAKLDKVFNLEVDRGDNNAQ
jgi:hypothetical protein